MADGNMELYIVAIASAVGCWLAIFFNNRLSKDKTYINVIMSDDIEEMKKFRDFLADHKITNIASDSYTKDWTRKTLTITAYAETKQQSSLIDGYIKNSDVKFKRKIHNKFQEVENMYEIKCVRGEHIEVYINGKFQFSADNVREARQELETLYGKE